MSRKRKYTRYGEVSQGCECSRQKCKWQGRDEDKAEKPVEIGVELVCPRCGNNEFYGLLEYNED